MNNIILGTGILLFSILLLIYKFFKKKFEMSNLILFCFFIFVAHFISRPKLESFENTIPIFYRFISYAWIFPQLMYFYTFTKVHSKFDISLLYHLIPVLIIFCYTLSEESKFSHVYQIPFLNLFENVSYFGKIHSRIGVIFAIYYHFKAVILIRKNIVQLKENNSKLNFFQTLKWIKILYYYFLGINLILFFIRTSIQSFNVENQTFQIQEYYILIQNFLYTSLLILFSIFVIMDQKYSDIQE